MHHGRPAVRHGNTVHIHRLAGRFGLVEIDRFDHREFIALRLRLADAGIRLDLQPRRPRRLNKRPRWIAAAIKDRPDGTARLVQSQRCAIAVIIGGIDYSFLTGSNAPQLNVVTHGTRQHHTGNIVIMEGDRPLDHTCRSNDATCADPPQPMSDLCRLSAVSTAFIEQTIIVIIGRRTTGAQADGHIVHRLKRCDGFLQPNPCRLAINLGVVIHQQAPAKAFGLFGKDHTRARLARCLCCDQPGDTAARNQHIAERIHVLILRAVRMSRRFTEARDAADDRFPKILPRMARMDERLVVKPRRIKPRRRRIQDANISI